MKAAIYYRVSTDDQEREGTSLQTQLEACIGYCKRKGYQVACRLDETYTGLVLERPKLAQLRSLIASNQIDILVVYCLDRLSRDPTHGAILIQELEDHHVTLEAVTETVESTDLGKLISYIRGFASKLEADKIRERTIRGKQARLKEGKLPQGTGIGIYGYQWDSATQHRTVIEDEARVVQSIFAAIIQGDSFHRIAVDLNNGTARSKSGSPWHPLTIRRIATNETYTGTTYYGKSKRIAKNKVIAQPREDWISLPEVTPPIISQEMYTLAQEAIAEAKKRRPVKANAAYLLTGFARCPKCGSPLGGTMLQSRWRYYQCRGARPTTTRGKICDAGYIKAEQLETQVWHTLVMLITAPTIACEGMYSDSEDTQSNLLAVLDKDIDRLRNKLKAYPRRQANVLDLLSKDAVTQDIALDHLSQLKRDHQNDKRQLDQLLDSRKEATAAQKPELTLTDVSKQLQQALSTSSDDLTARRSLFEQLRFQVEATPKSWSLTFKLGAYLVTHKPSEKAICLDPLEEEQPDYNPEEETIDQSQPDQQFDEQDLVEAPPTGNALLDMTKKAGFPLVTIEQTSA